MAKLEYIVMFLFFIYGARCGLFGDAGKSSSIEKKNIAAAFLDAELCPKYTPKPPEKLLNVAYGDDTVVDLGTKLTPLSCVLPPTVAWDADPDKYYTLLMMGDNLDQLSSLIPLHGTVLHWGICNIKGGDISTGTELAPYLPPITPPSGSPFHYVQLVYEHPGPIETNLIDFVKTQAQRIGFNSTTFITKHKLGDAKFGNYFLSEPVWL